MDVRRRRWLRCLADVARCPVRLVHRRTRRHRQHPQTGNALFGGFGTFVAVISVPALVSIMAINFYGAMLTGASAIDGFRPLRPNLRSRVVGIGVVAVVATSSHSSSRMTTWAASTTSSDDAVLPDPVDRREPGRLLLRPPGPVRDHRDLQAVRHLRALVLARASSPTSSGSPSWSRSSPRRSTRARSQARSAARTSRSRWAWWSPACCTIWLSRGTGLDAEESQSPRASASWGLERPRSRRVPAGAAVTVVCGCQVAPRLGDRQPTGIGWPPLSSGPSPWVPSCSCCPNWRRADTLRETGPRPFRCRNRLTARSIRRLAPARRGARHRHRRRVRERGGGAFNSAAVVDASGTAGDLSQGAPVGPRAAGLRRRGRGAAGGRDAVRSDRHR